MVWILLRLVGHILFLFVLYAIFKRVYAWERKGARERRREKKREKKREMAGLSPEQLTKLEDDKTRAAKDALAHILITETESEGGDENDGR